MKIAAANVPGSRPAVEPLRFRRAPLLAAALAFSVGDWMARPALAWRPAVLLLVFSVVLGVLAIAIRRQYHLVLAPALALWVVTGFWSAEMQPAPASQAALVHYADGLSRTVRGHIIRIRELPPRPPPQDADTDLSEWDEADAPPVLSFDLAVDAIEELKPDTSRLVPVTGGVRVTVSGDQPALALRCGETIELPLRLRVPERYRDPGAWQYADYLAAQGIGASASFHASRTASIRILPAASPSIWGRNSADLRCRLFSAQTWAAAKLSSYTASHANRLLPAIFRLTPDDAGMLNAMLFATATASATRCGWGSSAPAPSISSSSPACTSRFWRAASFGSPAACGFPNYWPRPRPSR
jgi:competence protein ComEC